MSRLDYEHWNAIRQTDYVVKATYTGDYNLYNPDEYSWVRENATARSNLTEKRRVLQKTSAFEDGESTNQTWYTEDTVSYVRNGGVNRDGDEVEPYYFVDREFSDYGFVNFHHALLVRIHKQPVFDNVFVGTTLEYVDTWRNGSHGFHMYSVSNETTDTTGEVVVRSDGLIKRLTVDTTVDGNAATFSRTIEPREDVSVTPPQWKGEAVRADREGGPSSGEYDCDDFSSQAAAQAVHEQSGGAHGLDGDGDGIACEALP